MCARPYETSRSCSRLLARERRPSSPRSATRSRSTSSYWRGALAAQDEGTQPVRDRRSELAAALARDHRRPRLRGQPRRTSRSGRCFGVYLVARRVGARRRPVPDARLVVGAPRDAVRRALLVGIALNPVTIILVCQHGNSDVQVGLLVTLAMAALIAYRALARRCPLALRLPPARARRPREDRSARPRTRSWRQELGSRRAPGRAARPRTLLLGPAALGSERHRSRSSRARSWDHVIGYRSDRGFFGLAGDRRGRSPAFASHARICASRAYCDARCDVAVAIVVMLVALARRLLGVSSSARGTPLCTRDRLFLLVATVPLRRCSSWRSALGRTAPHYAYWFMPCARRDVRPARRRLAQAPAGRVRRSRRSPYAIEYAFIPFLGACATAIARQARSWIEETSAST